MPTEAFIQYFSAAFSTAWSKRATFVHFHENEIPSFRCRSKIISDHGIPPTPPELFREFFLNSESLRHIDCKGEWRACLRAKKVRFCGSSGEGFDQKGQTSYILAKLLPHTPYGIESLNLPFDSLKVLNSISSGIILVAGPDHSGITSTIASCAPYFGRLRNGTGFSCCTIEEEVEYVLTGAAVCGITPANVIVHQHDLSDFPNWETMVSTCTGGDYDLVCIGNALPVDRSSLEPVRLTSAMINMAATGKLVIAGVNANSASAAILSLLDHSKNSGGAAFAKFLRGIIVQDIVRSRANDHSEVRVVASFIPFSEAVRKELAKALQSRIDPDRVQSVISGVLRSKTLGMFTCDSALEKLDKSFMDQIRISDH